MRRSGEYTKALAHFEKAVALYSSAFADHPNLARALVNAAYVKRLIALDLLHRSKSGKARGRPRPIPGNLSGCFGSAGPGGEIYFRQHHHSGIGSVLVNAGHLHLDSGISIEQRARPPRPTAWVKSGKITYSWPGHAFFRLRCRMSVWKSRSASRGSVTAWSSCAKPLEDAIALAKLTQNNRLLAGAYIARSSVAANEFFQDWKRPRRSPRWPASCWANTISTIYRKN